MIVLMMSGVFFLMILAVEGLYRLAKMPPEWTRKLQHVISGGIATCFPWIFSSPKEIVALGLIMMLLLKKMTFLTSLRDVKRKTRGELYFLLSIMILSVLAWDKPPIFYCVPVLILTLADSLAAIVGGAIKTFSYRGKTLAGSCAFFLCAFLIVSISSHSILMALAIALCTTVVEALSRKGIDNLLIPLVAFYALAHWEIAGCAALVVILFFPKATLRTQIKGGLGVIGHYEALTERAGVAALKRAQRKLKKRGAKQIIGPMNGNTWNHYRLALDDAQPFFFGEPRNPPAYHDHFIKAGFSIAEKYESRIVLDLLERKDACRRLGAKMRRLGISVEPLRMECFDRVLQEIYAMSVPAFAENRFYEPIDFEEFSGIYQKIKPFLQPDFVQLAYDKERRLVGYAFCYEDVHDPSRLVFKTLAVDKRVRASGLGVYLFDLCHLIAAEKGKKAVIHALMHAKHPSVKLSRIMNSQHFRSYAIYSQ